MEIRVIKPKEGVISIEIITFKIKAGNVTLKTTFAIVLPFSSEIMFSFLRIYPIIIIVRDTGLSRKEIRKMIDRKKKERYDYSSDRIALLKLAKDLCVEFSK